jgi:hypothetical protein
MRLAGLDDAGVAAEAERVLGEISTDRLALKATREGLQAQQRAPRRMVTRGRDHEAPAAGVQRRELR